MRVSKLMIIGTCLFAGAFFCAGADDDNIAIKEDFSSYKVGSKPKVFAEGNGVIKTENARNYLEFPKGFMGVKYFDFMKTIDLKNMTLSFSFRPKAVPFNFAATVKGWGKRDKVPYTWYYITFHEKRVVANPHNIAEEYRKEFIGDLKKPLEPDKWYDVIITIKDDNVKVFIDYGDEMLKVLEFDALPGEGSIDFYRYGEAGIDLADIEVRRNK